MDFSEELPRPCTRVEVVPLGAGRDIGRSCVAVHFYLDNSPKPSATVVFDCGLHVGHENPEQAFPDFSQLEMSKVDCFLISHIHIDHCGALPQLTERHQFQGPIFMSAPTKALLPRMLDDQLRNRGFSSRDVSRSVAKCLEMDHRRDYEVKPGLHVKMFRAGHVLGAVMFLVTFHGKSVLYTGDYNATPDRHLGAYEQIGPEPVDVLITESTYGTTTRGSALSQEREFLDQVTRSLTRGGKVLIPTYALGRVPEMISLLEAHWRRMDFGFKILLCTREAAGVNRVYEDYEGWGPSREQPFGFGSEGRGGGGGGQGEGESTVLVREPTELELNGPEPLVLIATSAMLAGGLALKAFRLWAGGDKNAVIFPGACVRGTLGFKLLNMPIPGELDKQITVRCSVSIASFNAHTDCKGILQLVHQTRPREHVVLVHGVQVQMEALKRRMERELSPKLDGKISFPENLQVLRIDMPNTANSKKQRVAVEVDESRLVMAAKTPYKSLQDFCRAASFRFQELCTDGVLVETGGEGIEFSQAGRKIRLVYSTHSHEIAVVVSSVLGSTTATVQEGDWTKIAHQVACEL
ncbi:hypothetical protein BASA81_004478 [Batrachochytrium salamandrivorans]|nr:hypothetical protein BASA81_004478 [Batrachochytrium salamandrivorans]